MAGVEVVIVNLNGKARDATLNGRPYKVADATMIVPGVLPGSQGPLLYTPEETAKNPSAWDGVPLLLGHPVENGKHVSGRHPRVWEAQHLGHVFNTTVDEAGRLRAEAWFDVERTRQLAPGVLNALESGSPIELSTGLYLDSEKAPDGAAHNGQAYGHVARNFRPDHLAVLVGEKGACSNKDGCGINVANAEERGLFRRFFEWLKGGAESPTDNAWSEEARQAAIEARKAHGKAEEAAVPSATRFDGATASKLAGAFEFSQTRVSEGPGDMGGMGTAALPELHYRLEKATGQKVSPEEFRGLMMHLARSGAMELRQLNEVRSLKPVQEPYVIDQGDRAYAFGIIKDQGKLTAELEKYGKGEVKLPRTKAIDTGRGGAPGGGKAGGKGKATKNAKGDEVMNRQQLVSWLTANCDCWKGEEATLNALPEAKLKALHDEARRSKTVAVLIANSKGKAPRVAVNADGEGEVAGVSIADLADLFQITTDPKTDPVGFTKELKTALEGALAKLSMDADPEDAADQGADEAVENPDGTPVAMSATPTGNRRGRQQSLREWEASMPAEARAVWNTAKEIEQAERRRLVRQIVANGDYATEQERKADFAELMREPIGNLRKQIRRLGKRVQEQPEPAANYFGAAGSVADGYADDSNNLLPVFNVDRAAMAAEGLRKKQA